MAYITAGNTAQIRQALKLKFPNLKFRVRKNSSQCLEVTIISGDIDFAEQITTNGYCPINHYHLYQYAEHEPLFADILDVVKYSSDTKWYDNSDVVIDYFDYAFIIKLSVGSYDKPYVLK